MNQREKDIEAAREASTNVRKIFEYLLRHLDRVQDQETEILKRGFYAGQAMAKVELEQCHENWKRWNTLSEEEREEDEQK